MNWITIKDNIFIGKLVSTLIAVLSLLLLRLLITRYIKKQEQYQPTTRRRWIVSMHNAFLIVLLVLLVVIWMEQLRTITASLVLFAAAIVVATKEFILNIVGFFYRTGNDFISIGDRIEIANLRGDVIDQTFLGITIIEIGLTFTTPINLHGQEICVPKRNITVISRFRKGAIRRYVDIQIPDEIKKETLTEALKSIAAGL